MEKAYIGVQISKLDRKLLQWLCQQEGQTISDLLRLAIEDDLRLARHRLLDLDKSYFQSNENAAILYDKVFGGEQ
jgi:hypothetical protein